MYYILIENGKIQSGTEMKCTDENIISIPVSAELYDAVMADKKENNNESVKYTYSEGAIIENPEYENILKRRIKQENIRLLQEQIDEIDKKRIRAICEPSIKDKETGQTWLEYYNAQIKELREIMNNLEG